MNWLDIVLGIVAVLSAVIGWRQGLVKEVAQLAGVVLAILVASRAQGRVAPLFGGALGDGIALRIASFAAAFLIVYVGAVVLGWLLSRSLKTLKLEWLDRAFGAFFGAARGGLLALLALVALLLLLPDSRPNTILRGSWTYRNVRPGIFLVGGLLPRSVGEEIDRRDGIHRPEPAAPIRVRAVSV
jgi:membrane protein required for colicin V production